MPIPEYAQVKVCRSLTEAYSKWVQDVWYRLCVGISLEEPYFPTPTLCDDGNHVVFLPDVWEGYPGIPVYMCLDLPADLKVSFGYVSGEAGFNGGHHLSTEGFGWGETMYWDACLVWMQANVFGLLFDALQEANSWVVKASTTTAVSGSRGQQFNVRQLVLELNDDVIPIYQEFACTGWGPESDEPYDVALALGRSLQIVSGPVVGVDGISTAIKELAQQDVDIALNNGSAVYSVRSKEITEP